MNLGRTDTLRLTPKVARAFPVPGAARVRVYNVIYGRDAADPDRYRYVFTAEYTAGVVRGKRRFVRVGTWSEPRDRDRSDPPGQVVLAPPELPLMEQYRWLAPHTEEDRRQETGESPGPPAVESAAPDS
jgi:hypothetical protein